MSLHLSPIVRRTLLWPGSHTHEIVIAAARAMDERRMYAECGDHSEQELAIERVIARRKRLVRIQQNARRRSAGLMEARMHHSV